MRPFSVLLALPLFIAACSPSPDIAKINGDTITSAEIDHTITGLMDAAGVTGVCAAVLNRGKVVYRRGFGFRNHDTSQTLDEDTVMAGASLSKPVFAYLVMQLVQEGLLELDTPLSEYLDRPLPEYSDYADLADDERWRLLTARHCLSHTTGFPNLRIINPRNPGKLEFFFNPGSQYAYSGEGISLLQFVVEHLTGTGLEELASTRIFKPLGMVNTSYIWQDRFARNFAVGHDVSGHPVQYRRMDRARASGSILTTVRDYTRFVQAVLRKEGLKEDTWQAMLSPSIRIRSLHQFPTLTSEVTDRYDALQLSYGLGWGLLATPYGRAFFKEGHGRGWQHYNVNFIDPGTSLILMTNSENGEKIFKDLLEKLIGDTFTPWEWEGYIPYNSVVPKPIDVYLYDIILLQDVHEAIAAYRRIAASPAKKYFSFGEDRLNNLAGQMIRENKWVDARLLYELNLEEYPTSANACRGLGEVYLQAGLDDRAAEYFKKARELEPHDGRKKQE